MIRSTAKFKCSLAFLRRGTWWNKDDDGKDKSGEGDDEGEDEDGWDGEMDQEGRNNVGKEPNDLKMGKLLGLGNLTETRESSLNLEVFFQLFAGIGSSESFLQVCRTFGLQTHKKPNPDNTEPAESLLKIEYRLGKTK